MFTPDANEALRANDLHVKSMQRLDRQSCGTNNANYAAQIERLGHLMRKLKNLNFGGYSRHVNNQELALAVTWLRMEAENPKKQWRTNLLWLYVGTRSCTILLRTFTKTGINFATRLELPGRSPSHDANSRLLCSEFHAQMKLISRANEASKLKMFKRPTTHE